MELKQVKPIHLRCPKCGYDFSYNSNHIEAEIEKLKCEITLIKKQITQYKIDNPDPNVRNRDIWYRKAQAAIAAKEAQMREYKKSRKATYTEIEIQKAYIFKKLVAEKIGKDEMIKLSEEAENQMVYYVWDMSKQRFTNFNGV